MKILKRMILVPQMKRKKLRKYRLQYIIFQDKLDEQRNPVKTFFQFLKQAGNKKLE